MRTFSVVCALWPFAYTDTHAHHTPLCGTVIGLSIWSIVGLTANDDKDDRLV